METDNRIISTIMDTDSYKFSHWLQYPPNTTRMYSYLESRGGRFEKTLFFGLQYYLKKFLSRPVTMYDVIEATDFAAMHGVPFNQPGWARIVTKHGGHLPVRIKAVPEGSIVPTGNVLLSVESTDPECFWAVSWIETMLVRLWYPITVATTSYHCKQLIKSRLDETAEDPEAELPFKLHDFGSRGVSSQESAMIGGAAHLINFMGSDTVAGIWMANEYYDCEMAGFSIPAAEHSTITMWGKDREVDAYRNMLEQYGDQPIMAVMSDSYDIWNAAGNLWGGALKSEVEAYEGTLVIRPDSGDPPEVVVNLLGLLALKFGTTVNSKGYEVIGENVRVIQGDGINIDSMEEILFAVQSAGYSTSNIAFGMGGGLLQQCDRDTQKFAFKCSWAEVDGKGVDVYKDPVTDYGKRSKRGRLSLGVYNGDQVKTVPEGGCKRDLLEEVYVDGQILRIENFEQVKERTTRPYSTYRGWVDREIRG